MVRFQGGGAPTFGLGQQDSWVLLAAQGSQAGRRLESYHPPPRWGTGGAAEPALAGCRKVSHAPRAGIYPLLQKNCYPEMELDFDTLLVHFGLCAYVLKNPIIKINNIDYINK